MFEYILVSSENPDFAHKKITLISFIVNYRTATNIHVSYLLLMMVSIGCVDQTIYSTIPYSLYTLWIYTMTPKWENTKAMTFKILVVWFDSP